MSSADASIALGRPPAEADPAGAAPTPRVIVPSKRRVRIADMWRSREVMWIVAMRDIKVKYKQSALGPIWLFLQPLGMLAAVSVAFSAVVGVDTGGVPYLLFALAGLCVWNFIQLVLSAGTLVLIANHTLIRRSACPRIALMNAQITSNLPFFAVILATTLVGTLFSEGFGLEILALPVVVVWLMAFTWGLLLISASISARFRDSVSAVPLVLQAGIFLAPVGYPADRGGPTTEALLALNPVTGLIEALRWSVLGTSVELYVIAIALGWTVLIVVAGWRTFGRMETRFADFI